MTKAALCTTCYDILSPYRDWETNRAWRWCQCDHIGVRWLDGARGLIEVTSLHGPDYVRVIGIHNGFLAAAIKHQRLLFEDWRRLHEESTEAVSSDYLFHRDKRNCWALVVRVGESGDVTYVDWPTAKYPPRPALPEE